LSFDLSNEDEIVHSDPYVGYRLTKLHKNPPYKSTHYSQNEKVIQFYDGIMQLVCFGLI